jgi:endoglucanase
MDEIGWVVRHITSDGFLLVDSAQGSPRDPQDVRHPAGHTALVHGRDGVVASGIFAAPSGHVLDSRERERFTSSPSEHFVELGLESRAEVEALGVYVGSPVTFSSETRRIGSRIVGKAMDNRAALCVVDLLLERVGERSPTCELVIACTVHEEGGLHGAHALARSEHFNLAVVLDVGLVGDVPHVDEKRFEGRLGRGPILVHKDARVWYDHQLTWAVADLAEAKGIAFQHGTNGGASTDGLPFLRAGVPTVNVAIPTRYTHTAFEMVDPEDLVAATALLEALVMGDLPERFIAAGASGAP